MLIKSILDINDKFSGTAKILEDGTIRTYKNGKLHSENEPAIIGANGNKIWCINGFWHRENGPAFLSLNGDKAWYYKDTCYGDNNDFTINSWKRFIKLMVFK